MRTLVVQYTCCLVSRSLIDRRKEVSVNCCCSGLSGTKEGVATLAAIFSRREGSLCEPMGAGKPTFAQPGGPSGQASRLRESLCTPQGRLLAERDGLTLSKGPWVVAHPRSWCQGWDRRGKFRVWRRPVSPAYVSLIWVCQARLAGRRAGSDVAVHLHDSPTSDLGWYHGRVEL